MLVPVSLFICTLLLIRSFCSSLVLCISLSFFFFFDDTATTEIYTLSLHDALPICAPMPSAGWQHVKISRSRSSATASSDRKSTRLNSSHSSISYAVFCLNKKKKKKKIKHHRTQPQQPRTHIEPNHSPGHSARPIHH